MQLIRERWWVRGTNTCAEENRTINFTASPLYPGFHIHRFSQPGLCNTAVFATEKTLHMRGPAQFKPVLFKGPCEIGRGDNLTSKQQRGMITKYFLE